MKKVLTLTRDADVDDRKMVVAFLRAQADAIEKGEYDAHAAIIILYEKRGDRFKTATRRCNMDLLQQIGLMQCAIMDVSST